MADYFRQKGAIVTTFSRKGCDQHEGLASLLEPAIFSQLDAILHFGWGTVPKDSEEKQGVEWQKDLPFISKLTQALGQLAEKKKPYLIFSSTGAVYGECGNEPAVE